MKKKIGDFFGALLGYTIVFNVIFVPVMVYFWIKEHRRVTRLKNAVEEIANETLVEKPDLE